MSEKEKRTLSPHLASRIALDLHQVSTLIGISDPLWQLSVCGFAAEAFSSLGSSAEISLRLHQWNYSRVDQCEGLSKSQELELKHVKTVGMDALEQAVRLHEVFYGQAHEQSIRLRENAKAAVGRSR